MLSADLDLLARARDTLREKDYRVKNRVFTARTASIDPALRLRVSSRRIGLWRLGANREPNQRAKSEEPNQKIQINMTDAETEKTELLQWIDSQGFTAQRDAILKAPDALSRPGRGVRRGPPRDRRRAAGLLRRGAQGRQSCCVADRCGVPQHRQSFAENDVDLEPPRALEEEDWKALGVSVGHRAKIRRAHKARHPALWESSWRPPPATPAAALRTPLPAEPAAPPPAQARAPPPPPPPPAAPPPRAAGRSRAPPPLPPAVRARRRRRGRRPRARAPPPPPVPDRGAAAAAGPRSSAAAPPAAAAAAPAAAAAAGKRSNKRPRKSRCRRRLPPPDDDDDDSCRRRLRRIRPRRGAGAGGSAGAVAPAVTSSASAARGAARHPDAAARKGEAPARNGRRLCRAVATGGRHAAAVARRGAVSSEAARRVCGVGVGQGLHGSVGGDRGSERHHGLRGRLVNAPASTAARSGASQAYYDISVPDTCPCFYDLVGKDYNAANQDIMRSKPQLVKYFEGCLDLARTGGAYRTEAEREADGGEAARRERPTPRGAPQRFGERRRRRRRRRPAPSAADCEGAAAAAEREGDARDVPGRRPRRGALPEGTEAGLRGASTP